MKPVILKAPPPARPLCPNCHKPLRPVMDVKTRRRDTPGNEHHAGGFDFEVVSKEWTGEYHGYGAFCTMRCCVSFANAAHKAGYRLKGAP